MSPIKHYYTASTDKNIQKPEKNEWLKLPYTEKYWNSKNLKTYNILHLLFTVVYEK